MLSITTFKWWMYFVAGLRVFGAINGLVASGKNIRERVYPRQPQQVTALTGRIFATWTLVTNILCFLTARNPTSEPLYTATLLSFVLALVHFSSELFIFKTMRPISILSPGIVASVSTVWMYLEWYPDSF